MLKDGLEEHVCSLALACRDLGLLHRGVPCLEVNRRKLTEPVPTEVRNYVNRPGFTGDSIF